MDSPLSKRNMFFVKPPCFDVFWCNRHAWFCYSCEISSCRRKVLYDQPTFSIRQCFCWASNSITIWDSWQNQHVKVSHLFWRGKWYVKAQIELRKLDKNMNADTLCVKHETTTQISLSISCNKIVHCILNINKMPLFEHVTLRRLMQEHYCWTWKNLVCTWKGKTQTVG